MPQDRPKLLPLDHEQAPKFWQYETSGVLKPVVIAYLEGTPLTDRDIAIMRAYLKQWVDSPVWSGPPIYALRVNVRKIRSRDDINTWLEAALDAGIDPL